MGMARQLGLNMKAVNGSNGANLGFEAKMRKAIEERKKCVLKKRIRFYSFCFHKIG
jgi:hypothetical protein